MQKWFQLESSTYVFENGKYLKSIADTSIIVHYEIRNGTDTLSIKVNNIVSNYAKYYINKCHEYCGNIFSW